MFQELRGGQWLKTWFACGRMAGRLWNDANKDGDLISGVVACSPLIAIFWPENHVLCSNYDNEKENCMFKNKWTFPLCNFVACTCHLVGFFLLSVSSVLKQFFISFWQDKKFFDGFWCRIFFQILILTCQTLYFMFHSFSSILPTILTWQNSFLWFYTMYFVCFPIFD